MKINKYKEPVYKAGSPELTINLKEILLNAEWYYKIDNKKSTDFQVYTLYLFAFIWFVSTFYSILFLLIYVIWKK